MFQLLFETLEKSLGPALAPVGSVVYWGALALLALVALVPLARVWMESRAWRLHMTQRWIMTCPQCARRSVVQGRQCSHCGRDVHIPWTVRLWTGIGRERETRFRKRARWITHTVGSLGFLVLTVWLGTTTLWMHPQGELHRLFAGVTGVAWAGTAWLAGRAFTLSRHGPVSRGRDLVLALASLGVLAVALILTDAARPTAETLLARFSVEDRQAVIGHKSTALGDDTVVFEYLQLDHQLLGYHEVIPLALVGKERISFGAGMVETWIIGHLRRHAEDYTARGLAVRWRSDRLRVSPGHRYEVVDRRGQVLIRRANRG